jgi:hypothetical protein
MIHELDIKPILESRTDNDLLITLHECAAVLSCIDSSMDERIEAAQKAETVIESRIGAVHWLRNACCEGECDVCNAHPTAS